jgi:hypothetical protein
MQVILGILNRYLDLLLMFCPDVVWLKISDYVYTQITDSTAQKIPTLFMKCHCMIYKLGFGVELACGKKLSFCFCKKQQFQTLRQTDCPLLD